MFSCPCNGEPGSMRSGDMGEIPFDVSDPDFDSGRRPMSDSFASESFRHLAPKSWFFCLNFSSQPRLFTLAWHSVLPTVVAKNRAFSRMISSFKGSPWRWCFLAQFDRARSISGNFPFVRLMGDRASSSGDRYFSFCRKTLDTVLYHRSAIGAIFF